MKWCIGFPWCREQIAEGDIACHSCWFKVPIKLRNEAKAVNNRWRGTKLSEEVTLRFKDHLHRKLAYSAKIAKIKRDFTIVG